MQLKSSSAPLGGLAKSLQRPVERAKSDVFGLEIDGNLRDFNGFQGISVALGARMRSTPQGS